MANVAFAYNDRDGRAMESALSILESMANRGNEYIRARHELLLKLRKSMSEQAGKGDLADGNTPYNVDTVYTLCTDTHDGSSSPVTSSKPDFQHFQDLSFDLDSTLR